MEKQEISKDGSTLMFNPLTITSFNAKNTQDTLIALLDGCNSININLKDTTDFDVSGLQLVKALENTALVNGLDIKITNIPTSISTKLNMLGVSL